MELELKKLLPDGSIRRLSTDDFDVFVKLEELVNFTENNTPPDHSPPKWSREEFIAYCERGEIATGIYDKEDLVAFYIINPKSSEIYITELGVHPKYRGKGLGTFLLECIEHEGTKRNIDHFSLSVDPYNGPALKLYFKNHFVATGFKRGYFGPKHPNTHRLILEKKPSLQIKTPKHFKEIKVCKFDELQKACKENFLGTRLILSEDYNPKESLILFEK